MASQETHQMTEKPAQSPAAAPLSVPAQAHSLPQEFIAAGYQPYYQPYPGQQAVAQPPAQTSKAAELVRLVAHGIAILLSVIDLALSLSSFKGGRVRVVILPIAPAGIALLWSLSEVITRAVRKLKAGIHPGAHVGVSLIIWLLSAIMTSSLAAYASLMPDDNDQDCTYLSYDRNGNLQTYNRCSDPARYPKSKVIGVTVITGLLFALFFGLFIDACICTHRRNVAAKRPVMVIAQPQNWPAAAQGWQSMPQHDASAENVQIQTPPAAAAATTTSQGPAIREYYAHA
ncbi:hypothetical protein Trco_000065 [Trichoderma cornu-damae]|uniref:MARVEL domain-containing protein n=1 Tax=Trichoderma cornu-damae TaxID=654480 RepID=A0A9P8QR88_9HYPO|nr:hypothetical protein Trco_000065 [Trichoderma cornu-damae]